MKKIFEVLCANTGDYYHDDSYQPPVQQEQNGSRAEISVSPKFDFKKFNRIAVIPLKEEGKTKQTNGTDNTIASKFSMALMDLGFVLIDSDQVENFFKSNNADYDKALSNNLLKKMKKDLGIDMLVKGTVQYYYVPGQGVSVGNSGSGYANQWGASVNNTAGGAIYKEGFDALSAESFKFINTEDGSVLISTYCAMSDELNQMKGSLSKEIALAIKNKIVAVNDVPTPIVLKARINYSTSGTTITNKNSQPWENTSVTIFVNENDSIIEYKSDFQTINAGETIKLDFGKFVGINNETVPANPILVDLKIKGDIDGHSAESIPLSQMKKK